MDIQRIYSEAKVDLGEIVSNINPSNIMEMEKEILNYIIFLKQASLVINTSLFSDHQEIETENIDNQANENESKEINVYPFERKLKGGILKETDIYIPESLVRKLGLSEGDLIKPKQLSNQPGKFYFELVQKSDKKTNSAVGLVRYGKVEKKDGLMLVSETTTEGIIKINESPYEFLLREEDIETYDLEEGDIVDIAYSIENISVSKVNWKYDLSSSEYEPPKPSSYYKEKQKIENEISSNLLKDKNILVVGCKFKKEEHKSTIESHGGTMKWIEGNEDSDRIEAEVKKSDCVILLTLHQSHRSSKLIVKLAKQWGVPFKDLKSTGNNTILITAQQLINEEAIMA